MRPQSAAESWLSCRDGAWPRLLRHPAPEIEAMGWLILLMVLIGALGLLIAGDATLFGLDWPALAAAGFLAAFLLVITLWLAGSYRGLQLS